MEPGLRGGIVTWTIRPALETDAVQLSSVAERIFRDTFEAHNTPGDMEIYCAQTFTPSAMAEAIGDPRTEILVAEHDGELIAYAHLYRGEALPSVTGPSPIELKRFYVLSSWHGSGLARDLMNGVMARSLELGAETLWLGVWENNHRAIRFYRKLGFDEIGEMSFLLGTDLQRDLVLSRAVQTDL